MNTKTDQNVLNLPLDPLYSLQYHLGSPSCEFLENSGSFYSSVLVIYNYVAEDKKVPVLLSCIGPKTYSILKNLTAPDLPSSKSLVDLKTAFKSHFDPKSSLIIQRFHFHRTTQHSGETIADFIADLCRMAINCEFSGSMDDALCNQVISGLSSESDCSLKTL